METRALLKKFEPDLLKRLNARLTVAAGSLRRGAQANFEKTGASGDAYRIKTRNRVSGFSKSVISTASTVPLGQRWSSNPGTLAAVFEFANGVSAAQPQNVQRTKSLIATLNSRYGSTGRFLWSAWDAQKEASLASIDAEIKAVEAEYTARLR